MKKKSRYRTVIIGILICTAVLHIAACFKQFCDWYTDHLYPYWAEWLGRLTAKLPFVLGEWLIILAAVLVLAALIFRILRRDEFANDFRYLGVIQFVNMI